MDSRQTQRNNVVLLQAYRKARFLAGPDDARVAFLTGMFGRIASAACHEHLDEITLDACLPPESVTRSDRAQIDGAIVQRRREIDRFHRPNGGAA